MNPIDIELHVFRSPQFQSVVEEAIEFFEGTPVHRLPPPSRFPGCGVYALYYLGDLAPYMKIAQANQDACVLPIYVGKAVPPGWRAARVTSTETRSLYSRLREHLRNIEQAENLEARTSAAGL
jgi:hypothetical protein